MKVYQVLESIPNFTELKIIIHEGDFNYLAISEWYKPEVQNCLRTDVVRYSVNLDEKETEIILRGKSND